MFPNPVFNKVFYNPEQLAKHGICSVLAIVIDGDPPLLHGIFYHSSDQGSSYLQNLLSLVQIIMELDNTKVTHGDICGQNICVQNYDSQLIDFGEVPSSYIIDIVATANLLKLIIDRMDLRAKERQILCPTMRHSNHAFSIFNVGWALRIGRPHNKTSQGHSQMLILKTKLLVHPDSRKLKRQEVTQPN